jgi:hypothetical protein
LPIYSAILLKGKRRSDQAETFEAIIENTSDSVLLISPDFKLLGFNNYSFWMAR